MQTGRGSRVRESQETANPILRGHGLGQPSRGFVDALQRFRPRPRNLGGFWRFAVSPWRSWSGRKSIEATLRSAQI